MDILLQYGIYTKETQSDAPAIRRGLLALDGSIWLEL
jgi:hypothetical protein